MKNLKQLEVSIIYWHRILIVENDFDKSTQVELFLARNQNCYWH
jgi:hypothetical protein